MELTLTKLNEIIEKKKTVVTVAEELHVTRQSIHKWLSRYRRFGEEGLVTVRKKTHQRACNRTNETLEQLVLQLANEHWKDGVETLHDKLEYFHNITLHPVTIYRILKRNNVRYGESHTGTRMRWKKKLYAHEQAGTELQMDTTYPFGYKQGKVIYTVIDDATRWVYAYSYRTANAENTVDFINKLVQVAPFTIHKIRTDQGKEFIAKIVESYLTSHCIEHRRNTPYSPEENGKIERFHRTLNEKALCLGFYPSDTLDEMQYKLTLFLHYYNWQKRHRGLGMFGMTPIQKLHYSANRSKSVTLQVQCYNY